MTAQNDGTRTHPLGEMLRLLNDARIYSMAEMADRMRVETELVRAMADQLILAGYLMPAGGDPSPACGSCRSKSGCGHACTSFPGTSLLTLTAKGRRAVARQQTEP